MTVSLVWMHVLFLVASKASNVSKFEPAVIGKTFLAGSTNPTTGSTAWALTSHGIAEKLFTVDKQGNIVGQVAKSVTKIDTVSWEVTLKADYSFSDGTKVTSQHVVDALTELNTVNNAAKASVGGMTVTVLETLKLKIVTERATPVMDAVLAEWVFVVYYKSGSKYVFTGPFAVELFEAGKQFKLLPNVHYPQAAERPPLIIKKFNDGQALATALKALELDIAFHLPVDSLPAIRAQDGITVKSFEVGYHYMMWHNIRKSPLSDVRVRRAVDLALDRTALAQELRGGKGTRSLFPDNSPYFSDGTDAHADKAGAKTLLDQAGWILNSSANNTRMKDGVPLTLDLVAYPQRPGLVLMQPVIEQALVALGVVVNRVVTSGASWTQLDNIIAGKNFDLLMWAQHTLPAGDPQWFLNNFFRSSSTSNHAGINSSAVDGLLDALAHVEKHTDRVSATVAAQTGILQEVPVSNLVTPSWHVGLSSRLSSYQPWGSDYYVIRADLFVQTTSTTTVESKHSDHTDSARHATFVWFAIFSLSLIHS